MRCNKIGDPTLQSLARYWPRIHSLSLSGANVTDPGIIEFIEKGSTLREFNLNRSPRVGRASYDALRRKGVRP